MTIIERFGQRVSDLSADRPAAARRDAAQSLSCTAFAELAEKIKKVREAIEA